MTDRPSETNAIFHASTTARAGRLLHPASRIDAPLDTSILRDIAEGLASVATPGLTTGLWDIERHPVLSTEAYDAWIMVWGPGSGLELHDHDGSVGVLSVLEGQLLEGRRGLELPTRVELRRVHAGEVIEFGSTHLHALSNATARSAVTLSVYSPPLGRCA